MSDSPNTPENATFAELGEVFHNHQSFVLISHVRPDGDAIGSQLALGFALLAAGKIVRLINEDGLPDNLTFMPGSEKIELPLISAVQAGRRLE
jgi:phosphoesterase RecJ-like protein